MPKIIAIREFELLPGVNKAEFEQLLLEVYLPAAAQVPGWQNQILYGDRGEREGKYVLLCEIESVTTRDSYFPPSGEESKAFLRYGAALMPLWDKMASYCTSTFTDYIVLGT
jgi:hypothetical protein